MNNYQYYQRNLISRLRHYQQNCLNGLHAGLIPLTALEAAETIESQAQEIGNLQNRIRDLERAGKVSEQHRAKPENRRWDTSYTHKVYSNLVAGVPGAQLEAANLLKDYHDTQHAVYEQRDELKRKASEAPESLRFLRDAILKVVGVDRASAVRSLKRVGATQLFEVPIEKYAVLVTALIEEVIKTKDQQITATEGMLRTLAVKAAKLEAVKAALA